MSYDDDGFVKRTFDELVEDYEAKAISLFNNVDFSPTALLWQQMKVHVLDSHFFETLLETASQQMSIQDAVGIFLDKHGIESGLPRRGATHAQGYVDVTSSSIPFTIPAGTEFASSLNSYLSDELDSIPSELVMSKTRTGESYDYFPSTVPYAESVVRIRDENSVPIASGYWDFDTVYNNNIYWYSNSSGVILADELYTVEFGGSVTKRIEVSSVSSGLKSNAKIGEVTTCVTFPSLSVTNSIGISGAIDKESDNTYRSRQLQARRRQFTLNKVRDIALGINGVRAAQVSQDKGVDQTSVTDWDNPINGVNLKLDQYRPKYGQNFVSGDLVMSLGKITLKGRAVNNPPAIRCGIKRNVVSTGLDQYYDITTIAENQIDPRITGFQDINFTLNYNGLDKTKTYRFDLWLKKPEDGLTGIDFLNNYWLFKTSKEGYGGSSTRYQIYEYTGLTGETPLATGLDLQFKTWYNGAGYTVLLAPQDGFGFTNLKTELEGMLDYVDGGGLSPVGIQYIINEPTEVKIDIRGVIYVDDLVDFVTVRTDVITNIETYLESLNTGEDVIYSRIEYEIMKHPNVYNQRDLYIKRADQTTWTQDDVVVLEEEIADLGTRSLQRGIG